MLAMKLLSFLFVLVLVYDYCIYSSIEKIDYSLAATLLKNSSPWKTIEYTLHVHPGRTISDISIVPGRTAIYQLDYTNVSVY